MEDCIITNRLILREINESDADDIVRWRSDEKVYRFFKSPHKITLEEHLSWFHDKYFKNDLRVDYICIERNTQKKVGVFGFSRNDSELEINYLLDRGAQHKGYAKEAMETLIEYAKKTWHIDRAVASIHKDNEASISFIQKMGFEKASIEGNFILFKKLI